MKGTMLVIEPNRVPVATELTAPPELEVLRKHVGGYIEKVPHFASVVWPRGSKQRQPAVALCNEDGKQPGRGLVPNWLADLFWCSSLAADYGVPSCHPDFLVGTVVVLFGDREFMEEL